MNLKKLKKKYQELGDEIKKLECVGLCKKSIVVSSL